VTHVHGDDYHRELKEPCRLTAAEIDKMSHQELKEPCRLTAAEIDKN